MTQITDRLKTISVFIEKNREKLFEDLVEVEEDFNFRGEQFPDSLNELKKLTAKEILPPEPV